MNSNLTVFNIFTDGACSKNGKSNSNGGIGVYFSDFNNILKNKHFSKKISKTEVFFSKQIIFDNKEYNTDISNNIHYKSKEENSDIVIFYPTNIRAEGYAILYALISCKLNLLDSIDNIDLIKNFIDNFKTDLINNIFEIKDYHEINQITDDIPQYKIIIYTDCKFWIQTLKSWLPKWLKENKLNNYKNIDLIIYLYYYIELLKKNNIEVDIQYIKAHMDRKNKTQMTKEHKNNCIADRLAVGGSNNKDNGLNIS
jgi:ribonuclease HI